MSTTIEYNGSIVATIPNGNTATLPIADKKMKTDIVITVPEATDSAIPIEVSTEAEMTALLTSGEVGGVYKYIGETTDTYENGALYVLEEETHIVNPIITYLTFSSPSSFTLATYNTTKNWDGEIEYSTNTVVWNVWDGTTKLSSKYNKLYLRGSGNTIITGNSTDSRWVLTGSDISCEGNIENLLDYQTVANGTHPTMETYCYYFMFSGCTNLTTAPELPATTLTSNCYAWMFSGCTNLTTAPELPVTTLASNCYAWMFSDCTNLTTAPELPATTLAINCYRGMFSGCTNLTTAPSIIPADEIPGVSCQFMFENCTSLIIAPELLATTVKSQGCEYMFQGCTALTTAPKVLATTVGAQGYFNMFSGCTSLTTAPELPATTLASWCYRDMFNNCISLTTAPKLPATTLDSGCYASMFYGCTSLTTIPDLPATGLLPSQCYFAMFQGCTGIKLSTTQTNEYQTEYRIPASGTATARNDSLTGMFFDTGGTFTGTPTINTTYYTSNTIV